MENNNHDDANDPYLVLVPMINSDVDYLIDDVTSQVIIRTKQDKKFQNFLRKLKFNIPEYSNLRLDDYSSSVFKLIDGKRNVYEIGIILKEEHGEEIEPLYERLIVFLEYLNVQCKWIHLDGLITE